MKLFANEELVTQVDGRQTIEEKLEGDISTDVSEIITEYEGDLQIASEGFRRSSNELFILRDARASLESKKLSSVEYFTSIENYNLYLKSVANNLGVKSKLPSMEDFKNPYGVKASHQIVLEGFNDFIRSIWEKVKDFFKSFFKKIMLFLKRLVNADLQLDEYEEYIASMIHKVKASKKDKVDSIKIQSKLPSLLAGSDMDKVDTHFILTRGGNRLNNLKNTKDEVFKQKFKALSKVLISIKSSTVTTLANKDTSDIKKDMSEIRDLCVKSITTGVITNIINMNDLPDSVYSSVSSAFDREQSDGLTIYSLVNDRNPDRALPKNFNIFCAANDYAVEEGLRTSKIFIAGNTESNVNINNDLDTIGNANNLLKYYDDYKNFSKSFNSNEVLREADRLSDDIESVLKALSSSFENALRPKHIDTQIRDYSNSPDFSDPGYVSPEDGGLEIIGASNDPLPRLIAAGNESPPGSISSANTIVANKKEIEEFQRFMFNYLNSLQALIKEASINLVGTYQECRFEMIKLIYKSCSQF